MKTFNPWSPKQVLFISNRGLRFCCLPVIYLCLLCGNPRPQFHMNKNLFSVNMEYDSMQRPHGIDITKEF